MNVIHISMFTNINTRNIEKIYPINNTQIYVDKNTYPKDIFYKTNSD